MRGMTFPRLVVLVLSCALLSSCSWTKLRYQKLRTRLHKAPQPAMLDKIQPSAAQQAEARKLLRSLAVEKRRAQQQQERAYTEQLMIPEEATEFTNATSYADPAAYAEPTRPEQAAAPARPAPATGNSGYNSGYSPARFVPRGAPDDIEAPDGAPGRTPQEPGAVMQRGLRSPHLPATLPMDINGKLR